MMEQDQEEMAQEQVEDKEVVQVVILHPTEEEIMEMEKEEVEIKVQEQVEVEIGSLIIVTSFNKTR